MNNELYFTRKCEKGETEHRKDLVFMHQIQTGKLVLFEYEFVPKLGGASAFEESGLETNGDKDFYIEKADGTLIYLSRLGFKKTLKEIAATQPECLSMTEEKDFSYKKIPDIIRCYNSK